MMGVGAKRALGLYRSCAPRHLAAGSAALFTLLALIGGFHQDWYKSSYAAVPAHRYYTFYPVLCQNSALLKETINPQLSVYV